MSQSVLDAIERGGSHLTVASTDVYEAVRELSHLFTRQREELPGDYLEHPRWLAAYVHYFLPVNLAKIQTLLDEIPRPDFTQPMRVLDIGSGPGTGPLAVVDWWWSHRPRGCLSVVAVDQSRHALHLTSLMWDAFCRGGPRGQVLLHTHNHVLDGWQDCSEILSEGEFDLIIVANSLSEITARYQEPTRTIAEGSEFLAALLKRLARDGTLMVVEPALRVTSRMLHRIRNRLLEMGICTIYSPCLHDRNCPALDHPNDWCHEERPWDPPQSIREIDMAVGFIKDALKFSYLLLRKDGKTIVARQSTTYRVVSELRVLKGEKRAWVCNEQGRFEVGRLDRLVSPQNAAFDEIQRGDVVYIEQLHRRTRQGTLSSLARIDREAMVSIVRGI
ncbi:MAG: small ribosomal subunit Rsm22 family protein [Nitrospira sp.]|nr:small ribosomal subunit Rsm22 family protein [Nitrospira sp.]